MAGRLLKNGSIGVVGGGRCEIVVTTDHEVLVPRQTLLKLLGSPALKDETLVHRLHGMLFAEPDTRVPYAPVIVIDEQEQETPCYTTSDIARIMLWWLLLGENEVEFASICQPYCFENLCILSNEGLVAEARRTTRINDAHDAGTTKLH